MFEYYNTRRENGQAPNTCSSSWRILQLPNTCTTGRMNEQSNQHLDRVRSRLQFLNRSEQVSVEEALRFLSQLIESQQIHLKVARGLITREEGLNLLLAHFESWLEQQGLTSEEIHKHLDHPESYRSFVALLLEEEIG